ncbi:hypothetical protein G7054_g13141 [Neopestalotiopsis clavispora]|nr:hypothetical protein G7054_g13141 [Neopestalotiopsis clavispora]
MMFTPFSYSQYLKTRLAKQLDRSERINALSQEYALPLTNRDKEIVDKPITELNSDVRSGKLRAIDVLRTYGKVALKAQAKTNCLTEILLPDAETWMQHEIRPDGPLSGIPVSLKDSIHVKGFDSSIGYARKAGKPAEMDGTMTRILKDLGAIPYVKTALPTTLLSFESSSGLWGCCSNPHNPAYSPGGSSGGESALIALGGRVGVGSDVAGSVRVPAAWSGIYALRCSTGRWPKSGSDTSMPGQEGIPSVQSPMARTLDDLTYFTRAVIQQRPWDYDPTVHPIAWREEVFESTSERPCKIGLMRSDGIVPPTPAIERAVVSTAKALAAAGHEVEEITFPKSAHPSSGLRIASALLNADGCQTFNSFLYSGEPSDPGAERISRVARLPGFLRRIWSWWVRHVRRDSYWADLIVGFGPKTAYEQWALVAQRETFRAAWHQWWDSASYDFILCPVNATPALPHGAMADAMSSCGYTFLWNLLDYSAGVIPVSKVNAVQDDLGAPYREALRELGSQHAVACGAWQYYDAKKMEGLPTAVQIIGRRWSEEKVLGYMSVVEDAIENHGHGKYEVLEII